jgi:UDP-N-acetyl-D-mannosaminuronic acid transferase (WecB/TagA/CpsF family)
VKSEYFMRTEENNKSVEHIIDMPVDAVDYETVLAQIGLWVEKRQRPSAYAVQTNVFSIVTAIENNSYREVLERADYSLPDGMPLV